MIETAGHYLSFLIPVSTWRKRFRRKVKDFEQQLFCRRCSNRIPETFALPSPEKPLVSIVVPVYNQYAFTRLCLWSILQNTPAEIPYEVIIADDCSTDETRELASIIAGVRVIRTPENRGFLRNCRYAVPHARGKYILLLNNDTIPCPGYLAPLVETLENDPSIGLAGSKIISIHHRLQCAGVMLDKDANTVNLGRGKRPDDPAVNRECEVDYCTGACILFSRKLWDALDGFDERFAPAYFEETDLCMRVKYELGLRNFYQPKSAIIHLGAATYSYSNRELLKRNRKIFCEKWGEILARPRNFPPPF